MLRDDQLAKINSLQEKMRQAKGDSVTVGRKSFANILLVLVNEVKILQKQNKELLTTLAGIKIVEEKNKKKKTTTKKKSGTRRKKDDKGRPVKGVNQRSKTRTKTSS